MMAWLLLFGSVACAIGYILWKQRRFGIARCVLAVFFPPGIDFESWVPHAFTVLCQLNQPPHFFLLNNIHLNVSIAFSLLFFEFAHTRFFSSALAENPTLHHKFAHTTACCRSVCYFRVGTDAVLRYYQARPPGLRRPATSARQPKQCSRKRPHRPVV